MISKIRLKSGRTPDAAPTEIDVATVNIFVGPNNSGKSLVLREINRFLGSGRNEGLYIIDSININGYNNEEIDRFINSLKKVNDNIAIYRSRMHNRGEHIDIPSIRNILSNPESNIQKYYQFYLYNRILSIDANQRIHSVQDQEQGDLRNPNSTIQILFNSETKKLALRSIIEDSLKIYFYIDHTISGKFIIKLSNKIKCYDYDKLLNEDAMNFFDSLSHISNFSDGIKAFIGIIMEIMAGDPSIIFIDEPEAFLHPSLAYDLGRNISQIAKNTNKQIFLSTHNPQFIMGCIQQNIDINIIRVTYKNDIGTSRLLSNKYLVPLMRNPLLRSIGLFSALFYDFVVVTESDSDRVFYQEINERLLRYKPEWGIPNCLFLNAQNKQTVSTIIKPLRELGIPTAGILDIDMLKDGGQEWSNLLSNINVSNIVNQPWGHIRSEIRKAFESKGLDMKKLNGIQQLSDDERGVAQKLFDDLAEYGLFIVPIGEVESWLKPLSIPGHGSQWLISMLERLGENPDDTAYIKPAEDDIWKFLFSIRQWFMNPYRKGIPD